MKKIVHLSDLHIGYQKDGIDCEATFSRMVGNLITRLTPASDYVIVITGDLMESLDTPSEYDKAKQYLDQLTTAGFGVLVIPGNHDYGSGNLQHEEFVDHFKQKIFNDRDITYPKLNMIDNMAFIGLDSMAAEVNNGSIWADGKLGRLQMDELKQLLTEDQQVLNASKRIVYLHHRPFDYFGPGHMLNDPKRLRDAIRDNNVDLLLFGHRHRGRAFHGEWDIPRVYDAGSSTKKDGQYAPHMVIDLASDDPISDQLTDFY